MLSSTRLLRFEVVQEAKRKAESLSADSIIRGTFKNQPSHSHKKGEMRISSCPQQGLFMYFLSAETYMSLLDRGCLFLEGSGDLTSPWNLSRRVSRGAQMNKRFVSATTRGVWD